MTATAKKAQSRKRPKKRVIEVTPALLGLLAGCVSCECEGAQQEAEGEHWKYALEYAKNAVSILELLIAHDFRGNA